MGETNQDYLHQYVRPVDDERFGVGDEAKTRQMEKIGEAEYSEDEGTIEITRGELTFIAKYKKYKIDSSHLDYAKQIGDRPLNYDELKEIDPVVATLAHDGLLTGDTPLCELVDLTITSTSNKTLNFQDFSPAGQPIVFNPEGSGHESLQTAGTDCSFIYVDADICSEAGIFSLLHEIGHYYSQKIDKLNNYRQAVARNGEEKHDQEDLEALLREERNAWAFALGRIKPLLARNQSQLENGYFNTQGFFEIMDHFSLASYESYIQENANMQEKREQEPTDTSAEVLDYIKLVYPLMVQLESVYSRNQSGGSFLVHGISDHSKKIYNVLAHASNIDMDAKQNILESLNQLSLMSLNLKANEAKQHRVRNPEGKWVISGDYGDMVSDYESVVAESSRHTLSELPQLIDRLKSIFNIDYQYQPRTRPPKFKSRNLAAA